MTLETGGVSISATMRSEWNTDACECAQLSGHASSPELLQDMPRNSFFPTNKRKEDCESTYDRHNHTKVLTK